MKHFFLFVFCLITLQTNAQTYKFYSTKNIHNQLRLNTKTGEVQQVQDDGQAWNINYAVEYYGEKENRFCLTETQNMWNFILLDTYTGKTWQVQFSTKGEEYMFAEPINAYSLAYPSESSVWTNRFKIFPTKNMWNFILLDSYNGRLWQVQYSTENFDNLMCIPINNTALIDDVSYSLFTIQPLTSMYQYYLINEQNGDMWKFQWSTKGDDYRWIEKFR